MLNLEAATDIHIVKTPETLLKTILIVNRVVPCISGFIKHDMIGKTGVLLILMALLYVSDARNYLDTVLRHVKSEQGRSLRCLRKRHVSVHRLINVIPQCYAYIPCCCAIACYFR